MKKVISVLVAAGLIGSLMVGCGQSGGTDSMSASGNTDNVTKVEKNEKKELVFWAPFAGGDFEFMKSMVDEYNNSNPEYTVELLSKDWGDSYYQSINSALIANQGPDVFVLHQSRLAEFIPTNKLKEISDIDAGVDWSGYNEAPLESVTIEGVQYSIPLDTHALVMYYNKDILSRAGVEESDLQAVTSLEQWNVILDKINGVIEDNEHVLDVVSSGANLIQQFWTWYVLNAQGGGSFVDDNKAAINSPSGVEALNILRDWNEKGYIKNGIEDGTSYDIFKSGLAAIQFTGVWATGNYESAENLNFGVMPIPAINGTRKTWGDSHTMAVPKYISEERQIAAVQFADWINDHAITWAQAGHVPAKKAVLESQEYKDMPYRSDYASVINDVVYYPFNEKLYSCVDIASTKISQGFRGEMSDQEALDQAQKEMEKILSK